MQDSAQNPFSDTVSTSTSIDEPAATKPWVEDGRGLAELSSTWRALVKDPLTGLFSRNALLTFADDAVSYFKRYRRSIGILVVEIDALPSIIETHRLQNEDHVLSHVAEVLDLSVRTTDKVARFDVQRFIILLREISRADTLELANRVRRSVHDLGVRHRDQLIPLTVSLGAAIVADGDMTSDVLIGRAEAALAAAKAAGGDQVVFLDAPAAGAAADAV